MLIREKTVGRRRGGGTVCIGEGIPLPLRATLPPPPPSLARKRKCIPSLPSLSWLPDPRKHAMQRKLSGLSLAVPDLTFIFLSLSKFKSSYSRHLRKNALATEARSFKPFFK